MLNLNAALDFAVTTAREAGAVLCDYYRTGVTVKYKGEIDLVTEVDRRSEEILVSGLQAAFPAHVTWIISGRICATASRSSRR